MGAYEDRAEIMAMAKEVNQFKLDGIAVLAKLNTLVSRFVGEMDKLLPAAADEKAEAPKVARVRYRKGATSVEEHERELDDATSEAAIRDVAASSGVKKRRKMKPLTEEQKAQRRKSLEKARAARGKK